MQGPRLEQSLRQGLMMTPMMQQAVQMLQMSTLELEQHVELELESNPTLELVEEGEEPREAEIPEEFAADGSDGAVSEAGSSETPELPDPAFDLAGGSTPDATAAADQSSPVDTVDFENLFGGAGEGEFTSGGSGGGEETDAGRVVEETRAVRYELDDVLLEQLQRAELSGEITPEETEIARIIITNLDEQGYFAHDVEEFARRPPCLYERDPAACASGGTRGILDESEGVVRRVYANGWEVRSVLYQPPSLSATSLERVRRWMLKHFDPPGVAARDSRESLLVQLERLGEEGTAAWLIVRDHFEDMARNRLPAIARALNRPLPGVLEAIERVRLLEPSPSRAFGSSDAGYIVPDVAVEKVDGEWVVTLKDDRLPRLRVSRDYQRMYDREKRSKGEVGEYLKGRLESAYWLIKSIQQRQRTIYRVSECIVKHQRDFLEYGPKHLRPMTLRVVADDLGIHESTVSRVTTAKYIQTPRGIFELKYFFTNAIDMGDGEEASARVVKAVLKEIVDAEDASQPLADQKLAELLAARGYPIARRTVTKYREQLGILSARQRQKF